MYSHLSPDLMYGNRGKRLITTNLDVGGVHLVQIDTLLSSLYRDPYITSQYPS